MSYILEVDEDQLKHISKALDFYSKIQMGYLAELVNPYMIALPDADYALVDEKIKDLKKSMFPNLPENAYFSIRSKHIPDNIKQMVDIVDVINHQLKIDNNVPQLNKPFHWSNEKDLPILKKAD